MLSLGVIDGRNIWRADLPALLDRLEPVVAGRGAGADADRAVLFAAACADRPRPGNRSRSRAEGWLAFSVQKMSELATLGEALTDGRGSVKDALAASATAAAARKASPKSPRRRRWQSGSQRVDPAHGPTRQRVRRARQSPARALQPAALSDHDHRLVPADRRSPECTRRARQGRAQRRRLQDVPAEPDRAHRALAGEDRPRRAGAWRVRAQRHGAVFWRAACRLRLHPARLGAILWLALRAAAGAVRRRLAPRADDGRVVAIRAVADKAADEGDAHGAGDHPATGRSCATTFRAAPPAGRSRSRSATRSPTSKPPAPA